MRWNWQQPDWPNFAYDATQLRSREDQFLKGAGILVGVMAHLDADDRQNLTIELMAQEAVDSSAIEGEIWDLIGKLVDIFQPVECANYFSSCGYDPD